MKWSGSPLRFPRTRPWRQLLCGLVLVPMVRVGLLPYPDYTWQENERNMCKRVKVWPPLLVLGYWPGSGNIMSSHISLKRIWVCATSKLQEWLWNVIMLGRQLLRYNSVPEEPRKDFGGKVAISASPGLWSLFIPPWPNYLTRISGCFLSFKMLFGLWLR